MENRRDKLEQESKYNDGIMDTVKMNHGHLLLRHEYKKGRGKATVI